MRNAGYFLLIFICIHSCFTLHAQPGTTIDLKKPEKYENRTLASEKTTEDKIKKGKKFYQNTITHYNYYFNANLRLEQIINRAKQGLKDDYTKLLPYYNYTLDATAGDPDIDSVIYKCNAGILLHDLRNDWVDDLYFLMGRAYYLRKNFDSAEHVFLYISYAFAPKDDGYDIPIGSSANNTEFSIATKEKKKILQSPPRRNEDLIWVAKNYIDGGKPYEASAILEMLRHDPNFPERLQPELHETIGYSFYKMNLYDSAAFHLSKATDMDDDKQDKARREYLTGQLYFADGDKENAQKYFQRSADHTVDPFMAVYASLNAINSSSDSSDIVEKKIAALMSLAKKDRYVAYRDLIYNTAAQVEMQQGNYDQAYTYAKKAVKYTAGNAEQHSESFMILGDIDYLRPDYIAAKNDYDSANAGGLTSKEDQQRLTERLSSLQVIVTNIHTIHIEDSLQAVAKLPADQRTALIKKTVRQLRKAQGLKESDTSTFVNPAVQLGGGNNASANDLFAAQQASAKGDWYFNNNTLKSSGFTTFRSAWGNRPDVDNWRRIDAVSKQITAASQGNPDAQTDSTQKGFSPNANASDLTSGSPQDELMNGEITYDALLAFLPLTEDKLNQSNNKIAETLFHNGQQFQNVLEDYNAAVATYDTLLKRFPDVDHREEVLYDLYYCYNKLGRKASADSALVLLNAKYKDGKFAKMLSAQPTAKNAKQEDSATQEYEKVYDLFIEGNFEEAKAEKAKADSVYGSSYWTPQLLYIESIYYVSKHDDSTAINTLTSLTQQFGSSPLSQKAETMIDVLHRRSEIESYLTNLQVTRLSDDEPSPVVNLNPVENIIDKKEIKKADSVVTKPVTKVAQQKTDTVKSISGAAKTFVFNASDQQFVGIILNKVDPVYASETKNAFNRYNQSNFYNQRINVTNTKLNDSLNIVLLGPFTDAASALIYVDKVKPKTAGQIIPWLKPDKYSFTIISQSNLDVLNDTKDMNGYKSLMDKVLPGKF
jgi:outer membrane protein assembly factor BamD (BamD/ComL family)